MAINTNSSSSKNAPSPSTSAGATAAITDSTTDLIELNMLQKRLGAATTTPILKRKTGSSSKKLQFTTPEFSVTPIATIPGINTRLIPSRKRYIRRILFYHLFISLYYTLDWPSYQFHLILI